MGLETFAVEFCLNVVCFCLDVFEKNYFLFACQHWSDGKEHFDFVIE